MHHHRFPSIPPSGQSLASPGAVKSIVQSLTQREPIQVPPFRNNPLHDMESIWWLCMWTMFHLILPSKDSKDHTDNYHRVFCSASSKIAFSCDPGVYNKFTSHLSEHRMGVALMQAWSGSLNTHYSTSYKAHDTSAMPPNIVQIGDNIIIKANKKSISSRKRTCFLGKITRIDEDRGDATYHVHEYIRSKDTFLGSLGRQNELFTTIFTDSVRSNQILGGCQVLEVRDGARGRQEGHLQECSFFAE